MAKTKVAVTLDMEQRPAARRTGRAASEQTGE